MRNLLAKTLIAVAFITLLASCGNDSTSPTSPQGTETLSDYFPATAGTWWKYSNNSLDSLGAVEHSDEDDSTYVSRIYLNNGKNAIEMIDIELYNGNKNRDTTLYAIENNSLYLGEQFNDYWTKVFDLSYNKITITDMDTSFTDPYSGLATSYKSQFTIQRESSSPNFVYKGQSYLTMTFKLIQTSLTKESGKVTDSYNTVVYVTFAKGLGWAKTNSMSTSYYTVSGNSYYSKSGYEKKIINSSIK